MSLLSNMRQSYEQGSLEETEAANEPLQQFQSWFAEALSTQVAEPNAMTLATVGLDGRPSTRIVLVKDVDARGLVWYTNYDSRKGQELASNAQAALQFHWVTMERVVRIEGRVERVSSEESDAYYASRPLDSRLGAWASPQSQVIANRAVLVANAAKVALQHGLHPQRPAHWGGYRLVPDTWEFWAGRPSRLHDRLRYRLENGVWLRERLAP
jgi:pyridoxamine 5'-phosphate oxidase